QSKCSQPHSARALVAVHLPMGSVGLNAGRAAALESSIDSRRGGGRFLMSNFRTIDRETGFLLPPSVDEWLPEKHLARFVVEVVEGLDLRAMSGSYRGSGSASYHPRMLLGVDSEAKCNPVDSIGSSTKSRVSHSERRPSARFPGDKDGSARRNIEPLQWLHFAPELRIHRLLKARTRRSHL